MKLKLYLAHPFDLRYEVRFWELMIEKETGLELLNPFYDQERFDVGDIDAGRVARSSAELDFNGIVRNDLGLCEVANGALAVVRPGVYSIGTTCEAWYTATQLRKPVYFLGFDGHPWLRYMIQEGKGMGFKTWQEVLTYFKELLI